MKKSFLLLISLLCSALSICHAQSIYQFEYNQTINNTTVPTNALFLQHADGTGFLRTRYTDPVSGDKMLVGMELSEEYIMNGASTDTTKMYINTKNPKIILGNKNATVQLPVFLFSVNKQGELEPTALVTEDKLKKRIVDEEAKFKSFFVSSKEKSREVMKGFFEKGDAFLEKYIKPIVKNITPKEMETVVHLLIVADTTDESIGKSCAMDVRRVLDSYQSIVNYIGGKMKIRIVCGDNYNKRNVVSELKLINPKKSDIVIFYYSGHGYRKETDKRRYPYLDLRATYDDDYLKETLNMQDIYNYIRKKGARMNLVLSDCCNSYVGASNSSGTVPFKKKSIPEELSSDNIRILFLQHKISILATAADSTQRASSNTTFGGFFSYFFKNSLETNCSNGKSAFSSRPHDANTSPIWWRDVLNETRTQTEEKARHTYCDKPYVEANICKQSPCFMIEQ